MADMHLREKMKKVTEAAKHGDQVPEISKKVGLILFLIFIGTGIAVLLALSVGFVMNDHPISAVITFLISALLAYSIYKMIKAEDIRHL